MPIFLVVANSEAAAGSTQTLVYRHQLKSNKMTDLDELNRQLTGQERGFNRSLDSEGIEGLQQRILNYRANASVEAEGRAFGKTQERAAPVNGLLHEPDMATGGLPADIYGEGSSRINSIIGGNATRIADDILKMPSNITCIVCDLLLIPPKKYVLESVVYRIFDEYLPIEQVGDWKSLASKFNKIAGYTFLGDLILFNSETEQFAMLFTINPELVPLDFFDIDEFIDGYLEHEKVKKHVLQVEKVEQIKTRIGDFDDDEVYIAEPYQFLGGDGSADSYSKGNLWVYLDIIGGMQGVSK